MTRTGGGEFRGGKRGRGSPNKTPFVTAVAVDTEGHPIAMNMNVVEGFRSKEIERWAKKHLQPGRHVVSDGLACFSAVKKQDVIIPPLLREGIQAVSPLKFSLG